MKTTLFAILAGIALSSAAHADVIKTSSKTPNPAFPKTAAEIVALDKTATAATQAMGETAVGDLISYECEANTDTSNSSENAYLKCTFKHELPADWCYYGTFLVTYQKTGGAEGATTVSQKWTAAY